MLIIRSWPCPKRDFILLYTALNLIACTMKNASGPMAEWKKVRDVFKRGGGCLQRNVHMTFLVDKIDI